MKIREMFHEGAPDCVETIKWGHPAFDQNGMLGNMAAFKAHCAVNFWKASFIIDASARQGVGAGVLGRIESVKDLPPKKTFTAWVKKAAELNASGVKVARPAKPKKQIEIPDYFMAAIRKNRKALATYEGFSPSARREYIEWVAEAKQEGTRERRMAQAVEWMAEGKPRNWKYMQ